MKRVALIVLFASCALTRVLAQDDTSTVVTPEVSLSGGISVPYLPQSFRDHWKQGWNAGAGYGYSFTPGAWGYSSILANVEFSRFAFDVAGSLTKFNLLQKNVTLVRNPTTAYNVFISYKGAIAPAGRTLAPYFLLGVGYLHLSEGTIEATGDTAFTIVGKSGSAFAWTFGVGIELPITPAITFFVQGKSNLGVLDPERQYFPVSGGFSYRFLNK